MVVGGQVGQSASGNTDGRGPSLISPRRGRYGASHRLLVGASVVFVALAFPVVMAGAPLLDDFVACVRVPRVGVADFLIGEHLPYRGVVRPMNMMEPALLAMTCPRVAFPILILPGAALTLWVGWALRGLLRDLGAPDTWAAIAGAMWLLQPLGFEAALWPSAIHVPLGLALVVVGLRRFAAERVASGALFGSVAYLCTEVMFVMPALVWLVTPPPRRRHATLVMLAITVVVLVMYSIVPGTSPRTAVSLTDRILNIARDPDFYVRFPVIGLGVYSIPLGALWAFPVSLAVIAAGMVLGARAVGPPDPTAAAVDRRAALGWLLIGAVLVALVNVPSLSVAPRDDSPRIFTPTWLLLSAFVGFVGPHVRVLRTRIAGAVGGGLAAGAALSMALSAAVRVEHARFSESAAAVLAEEAAGADTVVICNTRLKVARHAPPGAFALHDIQPNSEIPTLSVDYYTGQTLEVEARQAGDCPSAEAADLVLDFEQLRAEVER